MARKTAKKKATGKRTAKKAVAKKPVPKAAAKKAGRKTAPGKAGAKVPPRLELGSEMGIREVAEVHRRLLDLVDEERTVTLEAGSLSRVDYSILQVIAAFVRDRRAGNLETRWSKPSAALLAAARRVDLAGVMGLEGS